MTFYFEFQDIGDGLIIELIINEFL